MKTVAVLLVALLLLGIGVYWFETNHPFVHQPPTWRDGTAVKIPVIAFDQGEGGVPVAGVVFLATYPNGSETTVVITTAGVVPPNITLIAGQAYIFQANAYGATFKWSAVMSDVQGVDICIFVNSATKNVTEIFYTFPAY